MIDAMNDLERLEEELLQVRADLAKTQDALEEARAAGRLWRDRAEATASRFNAAMADLAMAERKIDRLKFWGAGWASQPACEIPIPSDCTKISIHLDDDDEGADISCERCRAKVAELRQECAELRTAVSTARDLARDLLRDCSEAQNRHALSLGAVMEARQRRKDAEGQLAIERLARERADNDLAQQRMLIRNALNVLKEYRDNPDVAPAWVARLENCLTWEA